MERRKLLVVDAFADEPLGGVGIPILPDGSGLTDTQLRAVASEVGAPAVVTRQSDDLCLVPRTGHGAPVVAAVAGVVGLHEEGDLDPGTHTLTSAGSVSTVELGADRTVTVGTDQSVERADVDATTVAEALDLSTAAVSNLGLPVGTATGAGGSLLVPVTFLDALGDISPSPGALAGLLDERTRLVAFTFDTLAAESDIHLRVFESGGERAATGVGAAGCARYLATRDAYDGERDTVRVESGRFLGSPATLDAGLDSGRVTGRALLGLAGKVNVPADEDDDIVAA
jgi:trans-2,3-dihydro-3-hydroxyanthranilate isomerase